MLARMTSTEAKWADRVREWRASGKTAEEFAGAFDFEASTLRYWASRLKTGAERTASPVLAQVVRKRTHLASSRAAAESPSQEVEVVIGAARIIVRRGFDVDLLRQVAAALGNER